ncbi:MAG: PD40 domain-containing protein [Anaerolineales bacterium]|nr:PD40 domain-containing protein [Anaerolineales bacterium]
MKKMLLILLGLLMVIILIPIRSGAAETPAPTPVPDALVAEALAAKRASYPAWVGDEAIFLQAQETSTPLENLAPSAPETASEWTGIVMQKYISGSWEIFKGNGYDPYHYPFPKTQLTFTSGPDIYPHFNRGATKIVFVSYRDDNYEIYTMGPNGETPTRLTFTEAVDSQPQWSADGNKIVFVSARDENAEIYLMNADGSGQTRLTNFPNSDIYPTLSPDGSQIGWLQVTDYGAAVWVMNADGTNAHPISPWFPYAQHLTWSPDGAWLAWDGDFTGDGWNEIALIRPDGTDLMQVSPSGGYLYDIWMNSWLIDAQKLLQNYVSYSVYNNQLYFNGTALSILSFNGEYSYVIDTGGPYDITLNYDAQSLDPFAPISQVLSLPRYSPADGFTVNWFGSDVGVSGLWNIDVQTRLGSSGSWMNWLTDFQPGSWNFIGDPGTTIYFRSQAIDNAENLESWPEGNGDTFTTLYSWYLKGQVFDNRGINLPAPTVNVSPQALNNDLASISGDFIRYHAAPASTIEVHEPGFASALPTNLVGNQNINYFWTLSPEDNQISNGDFETNGLASWGVTGLLSTTQTAENFHLGEASVRLGQPALSGKGHNISNTEQSSTEPRIVRTPDNILHAIWCDKTDIPGDPSPNVVDIFYSSKAPGLPWTSPILVSSTPHPNEAYAPNLVVDLDGTLHLVWIESVYPYSGAYGLGELKYAYKPLGGTWSTPLVLDQNTNNWYYFDTARMVMDSMGGLHVTWATGNHGKFYLYKPQDGNWTPSLELSSASGFLGMAIDNNDQIYVAWMSTFLYFITKPAGGSWGAVQTNEDIRGSYLLAQPNPAGGIFIFFEGEENDNTPYNNSYLVELDADGNASPAEQVTTTGNFSYLLDLVLDSNGILHFAWGEDSYRSGFEHLNLYRQRFPDGTWSPPVLLTHSGSAYVIRNLDIWTDSNGKIQTVWGMMLNFYNTEPDIYYAELDPSQPAKASLSQVINLDQNTLHKPTLSFVYQQKTPVNWMSSPAFEVRINQTVVYSNNVSIEDWTHTWIDLSPWLSQTVTFTFQTTYDPAYGFSYVYLDDITVSSWLTPVPTSVDVTHLTLLNVPTLITITGENFLEGATARLNDTPLQNVQWLDEHTLQATIPANLPPGTYHLWVTNPGGQASVLANAVLAGNIIFIPTVMR